jgi:CubicO group peptidase (beta-lactamase class C family)
MTTIAARALGACLLATSSALAAPPPADLAARLERVDALATADYAAEPLGGIVIGVVVDGKLAWTKSYGHADTQATRPATTTTVFRIASITKQFTSLMLLQLVEAGTVRLSDPVEKYVPEIASLRKRDPRWPAITLGQLATHTAGLDREPEDDELRFAVGPVAQWEAQLLGTLPRTDYIHEPGSRYSYSNIGYAILGLALARAAGVPYPEYVRTRILDPLGMHDTMFELDERLAPRRATGFLIENGKADADEPERQERSGRGWRIPGGGLYSTLEDMAKFAAFEMGDGPDGVLDDAVLARHFERVGMGFADLSYSYGVGFQARRRGAVVGIGHDGVLAGYQGSLWMDPERRVGVVTLTTQREEWLGLRALEILVGKEPASP